MQINLAENKIFITSSSTIKLDLLEKDLINLNLLQFARTSPTEITVLLNEDKNESTNLNRLILVSNKIIYAYLEMLISE